mmetsp:Transcript_14880/g.44931  ORF Transcript_14880/g.44931 Transcript_14880/m.44931 type:complete len:473 (+) Transcript_14880:269-1687(+)|eukprot:CAMPEP_0206135486 /NCGR_PEP_ID=MMETSP1473-20131121/761_1 /ASSEMBLY_ACC=CAM_ASM_001109 /TAXON_ID=1461547 /ORGANISM="Stichococcus sp, Strain RCC1054" /LENGTH=472 /DNA_ID=CAMNT_0053527373 /DNA_START=230 /DNA_END=1648 /DNA_ORIENTATION=-
MSWEACFDQNGPALLLDGLLKAAHSRQCALAEADSKAAPSPFLAKHGGAFTRSNRFFATWDMCAQHFGQKRVRWQLRHRASFASISGVGPVLASNVEASSDGKRLSVEGPGNALRLHAEELKAAAEERAQLEADVKRFERRRQRRQQQQERQQRLWYEGFNHVKHMAAGALAACVSRTVVAPFERVKMECILRQRGVAASKVAAGILAKDGVLGFWQGNLLNVLRTAPYKAVNFSSYDAYRKLLERSNGTQALGRGGSFLAGALAGITASLTCFPLDVARTRILAAPHGSSPGLLALIRSIARTEGIGGLYSGVLPALISVAPSGAVFYGTYDVLKERHLAGQVRRGEPKGLGTAFTLLYGGLAGVAAETAVYPLQVVQRNLQLHTASEAGKSAVTALSATQALRLAKMPGLAQPLVRSVFRFRAALSAVYVSQGLAGFYAGLLPNVMQVLPNAALSYYAYEAFKRVLDAED